MNIYYLPVRPYPFQRTLRIAFAINIILSVLLVGLVPNRLPDVALLVSSIFAAFIGFFSWRFEMAYGSGKWELKGSLAFASVSVLVVVSCALVTFIAALLVMDKADYYADWYRIMMILFTFLGGLISLFGKRPFNAPKIQGVDRTDYLVITALYVIFGVTGIMLSWGQHSTTFVVMESLFVMMGCMALLPLIRRDMFDENIQFLGRPRSFFLKFGLIYALIPFSSAMSSVYKGEPKVHELDVVLLTSAICMTLLAVFGPMVTRILGYSE